MEKPEEVKKFEKLLGLTMYPANVLANGAVITWTADKEGRPPTVCMYAIWDFYQSGMLYALAEKYSQVLNYH